MGLHKARTDGIILYRTKKRDGITKEYVVRQDYINNLKYIYSTWPVIKYFTTKRLQICYPAALAWINSLGYRALCTRDKVY
jgi:hypothetical protein